MILTMEPEPDAHSSLQNCTCTIWDDPWYIPNTLSNVVHHRTISDQYKHAFLRYVCKVLMVFNICWLHLTFDNPYQTQKGSWTKHDWYACFFIYTGFYIHCHTRYYFELYSDFCVHLMLKTNWYHHNPHLVILLPLTWVQAKICELLLDHDQYN